MFIFISYVSFSAHIKTYVVAECTAPVGTALGSKRHQDMQESGKAQKNQGAHQQHQKTSQVSKAQLNSKTTLKGT